MRKRRHMSTRNINSKWRRRTISQRMMQSRHDHDTNTKPTPNNHNNHNKQRANDSNKSGPHWKIIPTMRRIRKVIQRRKTCTIMVIAIISMLILMLLIIRIRLTMRIVRIIL